MQLAEMWTDMVPKQSSQRRDKAGALLQTLGAEFLDLALFSKVLCGKEGLASFPNANRLLRWNKPYFEQKPSASQKRTSSKSNRSSSSSARVSSSGSNSTSKTRSKSGGKKEDGTLCSFHKPKKYHYGRHAVTMDSTARCVDPRIISESKLTMPFYF